MEMLNKYPNLRRLAWGIVFAAILYALRLPDLITAIRGW